jgi:hypothetical protein
MEDFKSDLDALRIKRAVFEEQLRKGEGDARSLQDQLRQIDAQAAALEEAVANEDASRERKQPKRQRPTAPLWPLATALEELHAEELY